MRIAIPLDAQFDRYRTRADRQRLGTAPWQLRYSTGHGPFGSVELSKSGKLLIRQLLANQLPGDTLVHQRT
jgi:hypothetical protein